MTTLAERIARCLPGASFELETLVRLVGIEETEEVPTAAVTTRGRARMLVNPRFVDEHCRRDEHLFLLVMHELWHVLLGHTTLYPRGTPLENLVLDTLINAGLSRQHPGPEYRGFFEATNPADRFPHLLLRPPVGWPDRPVMPTDVPAWVPRILEQLYPTGNVPTVEPTYEELIELLEPEVDRLTEDVLAGVTLLGEHREGHGADPMSDPLFGEVVRRIVEKWPPPPIALRGRDAGGALRQTWVDPRPVEPLARRQFAAVLRRAVEPNRAGRAERRPQFERVTVGPGPLPNAADRTLIARRRLVGPNVLPNQSVPLRQRRPDVPQRALVYLDVSGSMRFVLPDLVDLLVPPARRSLIAVRQFSTAVWPLEVADLARGELNTTFGTHIDCVLEDVLERPECRVVIVTDGYVGAPSPGLRDAVVARGVRPFVVLPPGGWHGDLAGWCDITQLAVTPYEGD
jgi:hypothetical protein